jgi:hypothetical protein
MRLEISSIYAFLLHYNLNDFHIQQIRARSGFSDHQSNLPNSPSICVIRWPIRRRIALLEPITIDLHSA